MEKNEELLQKLRDFRMEKMIELKNENANLDVDIEDVIYCGQMDFEINNEIQKKDVFLLVKNVDGDIKMEYHIDNDVIAVDINEMIIPTEDYQRVDFKPLIKNEDKRVSLNKLEEERINNISKAIGVEGKDIKASSEIDTKNLDEKQLLEKYMDIKSEFDPNSRITASESFGNLINGANKFTKIAVVYSDKTSDKFKLIGITNDGKVEEINDLIRTEGTNPTKQIITSNRDGTDVRSQTVQSMYRIKGRPNEGFAISIGSTGAINISYVREGLSIPVESTSTRAVNAELKSVIDRTKNTSINEEIDRAENELDEHNGKTNIKNIDDDMDNDIDHENIIKLSDGKEITFDELAKKIGYEDIDELKEKYEKQLGDTPEEKIENLEQEIEDDFMKGRSR